MKFHLMFILKILSFACIFLSSCFLLPENDRYAIQKTSPQSTVKNKFEIQWNSPGKTALGSMPIGNGDIGVNIWSEVSGDICFYLSKTDAWSENCRLLKLGKIRIKSLYLKKSKLDHFCQKLNLNDGAIFITRSDDNDSIIFKLWIDANNPVVNLEVNSSFKVPIDIHYESWRKNKRIISDPVEMKSAYGICNREDKIEVEPDSLIIGEDERLTWFHHNKRSIWKENLELQSLGDYSNINSDPLINNTFGAIITGKNLLRKNDTILSSEKSNSHLIQIFVNTSQCKEIDTWVKELNTTIEDYNKDGLDKKWLDHIKWWQEFWQKSWIIPEGGNEAKIVAEGYALQRYMNACSGRGKYPIKFNGSIFNVDTYNLEANDKKFDADFRLWGGPYWWQNTRLPYWSMLNSGDFEFMKPLFEMYKNILPLRKLATQIYYNHEGAFFPETIYFWGSYVDDNYGYERSCFPIGYTQNSYIRYYWQSGLELCQMMLEYYRFTNDSDFFEKYLNPIALEVLKFYDQHWDRDENHKIRFEPSSALETYHKAVNPLPDIAGLLAVITGLSDLNVENYCTELHQIGKRILNDLPEIPIGKKGDQIVLFPAQEFDDKNNFENPELYAIFPYPLYGLKKEGLSIAVNTYKNRIHKETGGWHQSSIHAAMIGETEDAKAMVVQNLTPNKNGFRFPAMWGPNYNWIPDQDHGAVSMIALQRMLVQYDNKKIYLLPAWPKEWDVSFCVHAPFKTVIQGQFCEGKIKSLHVSPEFRKKDIEICID